MTLAPPRVDDAPDAPAVGLSRAAEAAVPPPQWSIVVARTALAVALVAGWCLLYVFGLTRLEEARAQNALYSRLRSELASLTAPVSEPIGDGQPIGTLAIPRLSIRDLVFVQGTTSSDLEDGPGHLPGTPLPGQAGTDLGGPAANQVTHTGSIFAQSSDSNQSKPELGSVILGRGTSFGGPFHDIGDLHRGDGIRVTTGQGTFVYAVLGVRHAGDPQPATPTGARGLLTLVTSAGSGALGWVAPHDVVYVDAVLQQTGLPNTAFRMPRSANEQVLAGDTSLVPRLELALAAIALVGVGTLLWLVRNRRRWGPVQRWVAFTPLLIATAWFFSDVAVQLLPNVF